MSEKKGKKEKPQPDFEIKAIDTSQKNAVIKNNYYDDYIIPNHPSRVLFVGPSKSGKTNLLINLLTKDEYYNGYYHNIFVFSPNSYNDEEWDAFREHYDDDRVIFQDDLDLADEDLCKIESAQNELITNDGIDKSPRVLVILDDCIDEKKVMKSKYVKLLFTRGRHLNFSVWVATQAYNNVPLVWRKQLSNIFMFGTNNMKEVESLFKEYCHRKINQKEFTSIYNYCTEDKYCFMHIFNALPADKYDKIYRKNILEILTIQK